MAAVLMLHGPSGALACVEFGRMFICWLNLRVYISNVYVQPDVSADQLKVQTTVKNDGTSRQKI